MRGCCLRRPADPFFKNVKWYARLIFGTANNQRRLDARHIVRFQQILGEKGLERREIRRAALENKVHFPI